MTRQQLSAGFGLDLDLHLHSLLRCESGASVLFVGAGPANLKKSRDGKRETLFISYRVWPMWLTARPGLRNRRPSRLLAAVGRV